MNLVIGVDLDHTIVCYDGIFEFILKKFDKKISVKGLDKKKFNQKILRFGGLKKWHEIQALIYGKYIKVAKIYPGFFEFLILSKIRKNRLFIISHKTKYALYDKRIGGSHLSVPGPDGDLGFGGHCFPKDLSAIIN